MAKHTLKSCGVNTARFLKYVWPFYNIIHERVKEQSHSEYKIKKGKETPQNKAKVSKTDSLSCKYNSSLRPTKMFRLVRFQNRHRYR